LSTCPSLGTTRRKVSRPRRRRQTQSWDVGGPCRSFPVSIDPQIMASNSTSSTEIASTSGNFSQDSLDEEESTPRREIDFTPPLNLMSTSIESDSLIVPAQVHPNINISDFEESDLERELCFLQQQLIVATQWEEASKSRASWIDPTKVVKSWSSELAGNFSGNEKVKFSYENILSPLLLPIRETSVCYQESSVCSDSSQMSTFSLPEPVESAVKFLDRVRHNSTHDKFSPRPVRRKLTSDDRSLSANSSSKSFQMKTHRRASSLSRDFEGATVGGGAGAIGVTSMWIPVSSDRRRMRPTSPTPSQSSFCSLPSTNSTSNVFGRISLARKVLLHHQLLPNKTEGIEDDRMLACCFKSIQQPPERRIFNSFCFICTK
jgi:hypothetical protein